MENETDRYEGRSTTMRYFLVTAVLIGLVVSPVWAQKTTGVAGFNQIVTDAATTLATATIEKGKPKRILVAQATLGSEEVISSGNCDLFVELRANNVVMNQQTVSGENSQHTCDCPSTCVGCSVSATAYLDLDDAEAANPGTFKNQPIDVELIVRTSALSDCEGDDAAGTLVVQMVKK
jgi:hypothetical protein